MPGKAPNFYLIAGEASGDLHGHNLVKAIKKRLPEATFRGMGGDLLQNEGMTIVKHIRETNFMGFVEVVRNLPVILRLFKLIEQDILANRPDAVILIDYPGFNLRMAKFLFKHKIPVYYYISPQVWAWKKGRVKQLKKYVKRLLVILPFEKDFFAKEGLEVDFVGHPLLDAVTQFKEAASQNLPQVLKTERPILALLPGSRKQEIQRMLPLMLDAAKNFPQFDCIIGGAPGQNEEFYRKIIGDTKALIVYNKTYPLLAVAKYAFVTSGTATLETALFGVPEIVCYRGGWLSYQIAKRLINVKYISLVNLILDKTAVKELIQNELTPENLTNELRLLMATNSDKSRNLAADYEQLKQLLGYAGASDTAAKVILDDWYGTNKAPL